MNGVPAYDYISSKQDLYFCPFSQKRDAGNEIATFQPEHNASFKNPSWHWQIVLFKLSQKQPKYSINLAIIILLSFFVRAF